ncbi:WD40/YVTN/BNR-like repeat-containing protein [Pseudomonas putida]|uniref:WD40/YVTN/BNR-like repeat-containing protein n=1 Tax=Pseudomonas putida TaxID=303 RepID=UPI002AC7D73A|nr:YCF48-related protein [Pseudomonas putida]MDZ5111367.1 YCF48-related protein [Pseudomonas putida]
MQLNSSSGARRRGCTRQVLAISLVVLGAAFGGGSPAATLMADADSRPALAVQSYSQAAILALQDTGKRLVAVGERGLILYSDDGGSNWRQAKVPVSVTLTAVHFPTPEHGWAVGHFGSILHSDDGGRTWSVQLRGEQAAQLVREEAMALEAGPSRDTALINAQRLLDDGPDKPFLDVYFADERHGFAIGAFNLIMQTADGGQTWRSYSARLDNPGARHLYAIAGSRNELYIAGEEGRVFHSKNNGATFVRLATPYQGSYFTVTARNDGVVIAGLRGNAFRSSDHGNTWSRLELRHPVSVVASQLQPDGRVLLLNQTGQLLVSKGPDESLMSPLAEVAVAAPTSMVRVADGELLVGSLQGIVRTAATAKAEQ